MPATPYNKRVEIGATADRRGSPFTLVYAASKFAVRAIGDGLRVAPRSSGIKVTEVAPGLTGTRIFRHIDDADVSRACEERNDPWLRPEDVARAIVCAASAAPGACPNMISVFPMGQGLLVIGAG